MEGFWRERRTEQDPMNPELPVPRILIQPSLYVVRCPSPSRSQPSTRHSPHQNRADPVVPDGAKNNANTPCHVPAYLLASQNLGDLEIYQQAHRTSQIEQGQ